MRIEGGFFQAGSHCIGFCFTLPDTLASSFFYKNEHDGAKPSAKCKYHLKATFKASGVKKLMTKQILIIREKAVKLQEDVSIASKQELTNCCCVSKGFSTLKTDFEKNIYCPNECAKAIMTIDNSEC